MMQSLCCSSQFKPEQSSLGSCMHVAHASAEAHCQAVLRCSAACAAPRCMRQVQCCMCNAGKVRRSMRCAKVRVLSAVLESAECSNAKMLKMLIDKMLYACVGTGICLQRYTANSAIYRHIAAHLQQLLVMQSKRSQSAACNFQRDNLKAVKV
eukprot:scaffold78919_cov24-Tisochrysis_lutea.AAC.1